MDNPSPYLSLVVPAYRQAQTIRDDITSFHEYLASTVPSHEIIVVIDGDGDGTSDELKDHCNIPSLYVECFQENQGKGAALHHGFNLARGELVAFIDAGSDLSIRSLGTMIELMKLHNADIVIGSKRHSLSEVDYPPIRRLYSFGYQMLNRLLFHLRVRDTQVGLKLFRRDTIKSILPRVLVKRFAFDLELLVVAQKLGFRRIVEAPVILHYNFSSSISVHSVYETLWDTLAIFYRLHILHWYDAIHDSDQQVELSPGVMLEVARVRKEEQKTKPEHERMQIPQ